MKEVYLVSACLLGENCKYNGSNNKKESIIKFLEDKTYYKICPEVMGGLKIPRTPCEIKNGKVLNEKGIDYTKEYMIGAKLSLDLAIKVKATHAILQSRSPSCGVLNVYDGSFSKKLIFGNGITAQLLKKHGILLIDSTLFK